jgi:hypothetical protein
MSAFAITWRPSSVDCRPLAFHILIFSSENIFKKSANQKQELPMAAMFVNGSGQHEQSLEKTFHRCFHKSFTSFG